MKDLYMKLEEALENYDRARRAADDLFRCGANASARAHMASSMTVWMNRVASYRYQIRLALEAEGRTAVAS